MPASPVIPSQSMREAFGLPLLGWYFGIVQRKSLFAVFVLSQAPCHPDDIPKRAFVWFGLLTGKSSLGPTGRESFAKCSAFWPFASRFRSGLGPNSLLSPSPLISLAGLVAGPDN